MPTKYLDEEGLSHVVRRAKETFAEKKELWNWQKTEKAVAVAFEPVPDSVLEPVVEFKFKETLPAEGEKGPSNPSTIEGVSSATIWRTGKNLRIGGRTEGTYTQNGLTYTYNSDGSITFNGTATEGTFVYLNGGETRIQTKANFTYILSGCPSGGSQDTYSLSCTSPFNGSTVYAIDRGNGFIINKSQDMSWDMYIYINSGITVSNLTFKPQIEIGSIATDYEPPILLSEAIHVFSLGNTYYGGSVNLATGVMTVTHLGFAFDGTEEWRTIGNVGAESDTFRHDLINTSFPKLRRNVGWPTCSHFLTETNTGSLRAYLSGVFQETTWFFVVVDTNAVYSTNEAWKAFLATQYSNGTPVTIAYELETPFDVQLDPIQIKSLASLDKYEPRINTIHTNAESIQVGYQKFTAEGNFVHTTGDETIEGIKTFSNATPGSTAGDSVTDLTIRNPAVIRGVRGEGANWTRMIFADKEGNTEGNFAGRLGIFEIHSPKVNDTSGGQFRFRCYKYSDNPSDYSKATDIILGYDKDGIAYATAPSTSVDRSVDTDIVTRDWLPKDTRIPQKSDLWNWQKTESNEVVSFVSPSESLLEPTVNFLFKETLPISGTKGPDNPSTIEAVESVDVYFRGKNLLYYPTDAMTKTIGGVVFTYNDDGSFTASGTTTNNPVMYRIAAGTGNAAVYSLLPAGTYTLSGCPNESKVSVKLVGSDGLDAMDNAGNYIYASGGTSKTFTIDEPQYVFCMLRIGKDIGTTVSDLKFSPQLELGTTATKLEPAVIFKRTIQLGNAYYGGSIDLNTGIMTVTMFGVPVANVTQIGLADSWYGHEEGTHIFAFNLVPSGYPAGDVSTFSNRLKWRCTHFRNASEVDSSNEVNINWFVSATSGNAFYIDIDENLLDLSGAVDPTNPTNAELDAAMLALAAQEGWFVVYPVAVPYMVQLSSQQILSLTNNDKYNPQVNTIYTNASSVQVGYQRYVDEEKLVARDWCITNDEIDEISF